jgi:hypothetical protein
MPDSSCYIFRYIARDGDPPHQSANEHFAASIRQKMNGSGGRIRTCDLAVNSSPLAGLRVSTGVHTWRNYAKSVLASFHG